MQNGLGSSTALDAAGGQGGSVGERSRAARSEREIVALVAGLDAILWQASATSSGDRRGTGVPQLRYTYVSPQAERLLGYSPSSWLADPEFWVRCLHVEDRARVLACYSTGIARAAGFRTEYRVLRRDGSVAYFRDTVAVERIGRGPERRLHGVLIDIADWRETEEALRESEERYRELVENINECVFALDEQGRITYISPVITEISGFEPAEVLNVHFADFVHPEDLGALRESFAQTLAGESRPLEYRVRKKSGEVRWVRSWSRLILRGDQVTGVRGVLVDITEKKLAEEALRESQARYEELFENANDMIYTFDPDGIITSANSAVEQVSGYRRSELIGMHISRLTAPEVWGVAEEMIRRKLGGAPTTYETILLTKDGRRVPVEVNSRAVIREGKPAEIQGIARDLTERKRTESLAAERNHLAGEVQVATALARAGRELMSCREAAPLLERLCAITTEVLNCDCAHALLYRAQDDAYTPVAGYGHSREELEAMRVISLPRALLGRLLQRLGSEGVAQVRLFEPQDLLPAAFPARFGATVALCFPLRRNAEILAILMACYRGRQDLFTPQQTDIARGLKHLASLAFENARLVGELERANRLKSDFMATMSHELRTPLNVIMGYNQMLLEGELGPLTREQNETAQRIQESAGELLRLINATLAVGRLETGKEPVVLEDTDLVALLQELRAETRELCREEGVHVSWRVPAALPSVRTDPLKLKVILKNLISNAIKFTPAGSVCISAETNEEWVELAVSDTGIGIPEDQRASIFEPFYQAKAAQGARGGGVGLGLYVVSRLVDMIGASLRLESQVGKGSVFRVRVKVGN